MLLLATRLALAIPETVTVAVWMDGDNDLEGLIHRDLDELEAMVSDRIAVVAQVDRIPGYDAGGGDWTDTRRYDFVSDPLKGVVSQPVELLGEVNMGDGEALADFLLWAQARHPSDRFVVVMWNHGGGYWIASDDTSNDKIRIDDGELSDALQQLVDARGAKIDVLAFDACNMAEWEIAHTLAGQAHVMTASSAWVGTRGYPYHLAFQGLPDVATPAILGDALVYGAAILQGELTQSAIDLDQIGVLSDALDQLALAWLAADPATFGPARDAARGLDRQWEDWWIDAGELADQAALAHPDLVAPAQAVHDALSVVVVANYTQPSVGFSSGLTVFGDTSRRDWLRSYRTGPWADTAWDELLHAAR